MAGTPGGTAKLLHDVERGDPQHSPIEAQVSVTRVDALTSRVVGRCFRAVDPAHRDAALSGSRAPGRYSRADTATLYLSSTPEGVAAAMIAHASARTPQLEIVDVEVDAHGIVDLRDHDALAAIGIDPADAAAPWQEALAAGAEPPSWRVRDRLIELGAHGLIDPSRKRPGLWHLTLFQWNSPGMPRAELQPHGGA
ncbi:RES domain-containing protein [Agrococcus sp. ARC_14]|uniref:RES domain-containing protein n=1 Tax=Agrococcus sp. ARC_14 TaxID=2919927 RepID=UPI001F0631BB|nr:RES domain-containing protein [Agrococcus sp. ARC_14]MCH1883288.1 RES domain-containing protein [Agrococcus sp. ARC_14]